MDHMQMLIKFFDFCFVLSARLASYLEQPSGKKYEVRSFLERYQTWQPSDFDMFLAKNRENCKMMVDRFLEEGLAVESRFIAS
jgi:hypothetical protein